LLRNIFHRASYDFSDRCKFSSESTNCKQARSFGDQRAPGEPTRVSGQVDGAQWAAWDLE
jgi:hypothetical protein